MEDFVKMDIFFMVTTASVVLLSLMGFLALLFVVKILKDLSEITKIARREAKEIADDVDQIRADIKEGVADAREAVGYGLKTAKATSTGFAGASIVRTLSQVFDSFNEEKRSTKKRSRKKKEE
jgi:biopolymer transport protein ExbB/TolQ